MDGLLKSFTGAARKDGSIQFAPALYAVATLRFDEASAGFDLREEQHRLFFPLSGPNLPKQPLWPPFREHDITSVAPTNGLFDALPSNLDEMAELEKVRADLTQELIAKQSRGMWLNRALGLYGRPQESRIDFMARCSTEADRRADDEIGKLQGTYNKRVKQLEDDIRKAYGQLAGLHATADRLHHEAIASAAASVMGKFTGQDMPAHVRQAWLKVKSAKNKVSVLDTKLEELEKDLNRDIEEAKARWTPLVSKIEAHEIRLEPADIDWSFFGILWLPITAQPLN